MILAMFIFYFCLKQQDKHCKRHYDCDYDCDKKIKYKYGTWVGNNQEQYHDVSYDFFHNEEKTKTFVQAVVIHKTCSEIVPK